MADVQNLKTFENVLKENYLPDLNALKQGQRICMLISAFRLKQSE